MLSWRLCGNEAHSAPVSPRHESRGGSPGVHDLQSKISKISYGDANGYMVIFEADRPTLSDPNSVYPGQVLRIPPL
jgi:hypothetical protein